MTAMDENGFARVLRLQKILWVVFLATTLFYLLVAVVLIDTRSEPMEPPAFLATLRPVFLILGAVEFFFSFWIRRHLLGRPLADRSTLSSRVQGAVVTGWAVMEAIGILGLILVILGGSLLDAGIFLLVALVGILRQRPDPEWLRDHLAAGRMP